MLFKNATALEETAGIDTVIFDKTGTLTQGKPALTDVITADGFVESEGIVPSLARPGGNITGSQFHFPDIMAKRIELLRDEVPSLVRVAVIFNPATNRLAQR